MNERKNENKLERHKNETKEITWKVPFRRIKCRKVLNAFYYASVRFKLNTDFYQNITCTEYGAYFTIATWNMIEIGSFEIDSLIK